MLILTERSSRSSRGSDLDRNNPQHKVKDKMSSNTTNWLILVEYANAM